MTTPRVQPGAFRLEEAAQYSTLSVAALKEAGKRGLIQIKRIKRGSKTFTLIPRESLDKFLNSSESEIVL